MTSANKRANKKEDVRITRTKAALTNAFFSMLSDTTLENITVNDLCAKADVRRATFYKHFNDKADFIAFLIKDVRHRFDENNWNSKINPSLTKEYYVKYAEAVIEYLIKHETAIKNIVGSGMRATYIQTFVQQNYYDTIEYLKKSNEGGMPLIAPTDIMASMLIGGISHCIITWFEADDRCTPDELLVYISRFIGRVLT